MTVRIYYTELSDLQPGAVILTHTSLEVHVFAAAPVSNPDPIVDEDDEDNLRLPDDRLKPLGTHHQESYYCKIHVCR